MKILFDLSVHYKLHEGIMVYAVNTLLGFRDNKYNNIVILCNRSLYEYFSREFPNFECIIFNEVKKYKYLDCCLNLKKWYSLVKKTDCDIVFSPYPHLFYILSPKKIVQTIHDLQPLRIYKGKNLLIYRLLMPMILRRSYKIITISNFVKYDILRNYKFIDSSKIETIYNPIRIDTSILPKIEKIKYPYLLYVSTLQKYKNVETLIRAFYLLRDKIPHNLVIVGRETSYWNKILHTYIKQNDFRKRIIHLKDVLSYKELSQLYQHSDLFIHPSLMEGFGYTPIEAAIHKVPVITTKETAIYETTLGLLNYYSNATDEKELADKILHILNNYPSSKELEHISESLIRTYNYKSQSQNVYNFIVNSQNNNK